MTNLCHRIFVVWLLHAAILCGLYNRFLLRFSPLFLRPEQNPEQSQVPRPKRRADKSSWKASDRRGQRQLGTSLEESFCASNCFQLLPTASNYINFRLSQNLEKRIILCSKNRVQLWNLQSALQSLLWACIAASHGVKRSEPVNVTNA